MVQHGADPGCYVLETVARGRPSGLPFSCIIDKSEDTMSKTIELDGKKVKIEANALLPRLYRKEFGRDLIVDMKKMIEGVQLSAENLKKASKDPEGLAAVLMADPDALDKLDLTVVENVTWMMLRAAGEDVGESVEEWLTTIEDSMALYMAMPDVIEVWLASQKTTSKPKKK